VPGINRLKDNDDVESEDLIVAERLLKIAADDVVEDTLSQVSVCIWLISVCFIIVFLLCPGRVAKYCNEHVCLSVCLCIYSLV